MFQWILLLNSSLFISDMNNKLRLDHPINHIHYQQSSFIIFTRFIIFYFTHFDSMPSCSFCGNTQSVCPCRSCGRPVCVVHVLWKWWLSELFQKKGISMMSLLQTWLLKEISIDSHNSEMIITSMWSDIDLHYNTIDCQIDIIWNDINYIIHSIWFTICYHSTYHLFT